MTAGAIDKIALVTALRGRLEAELKRYTRRALDAAEAATHEENRPEGDKDMRSTEASYIARGQAGRAREIEAALAKLAAMPVKDFGEGDRVAASALVTLDQEGRRTTYFLVLAAGGERLSEGGRDVLALATTSPLGAALLGLVQGDEAEVRTPQGARVVELVDVR